MINKAADYLWLIGVIVLLAASMLAVGCAADGDDDDDDQQAADDDDDTAGDDDDIDDDDDDDIDDDDDDDDDDDTGCITGDFELVFGMIHSHSLFSDGDGMPAEAYEWARDRGELDFFALTDHLEMLYIPVPPNKWDYLMWIADEFNEPGVYVALSGFEYSSAFDLGPPIMSQGHNNVFFSDHMFPVIMLDYEVFYQELLACPDCLAQFNHPGYAGQLNWDGFKFFPEMDPQINLIELSTWDVDGWPYLFECLDQGWHVSPTWNQDNHNAGWGTEDDHRTGAWVTELTRQGVREVIRQHRTFSTLDKNASIRMMADGQCWMGSQLRGTLSAEISVDVQDPDPGEGFTTIELYGFGMELLEQYDCRGEPECTAQWTTELAEDGYLVARAIQADGDILVSAPIWLYSEN